MRKSVLMLLTLLLAVPAVVRAEGSTSTAQHQGLYRETQFDVGALLTGLSFAPRTVAYPYFSVGAWFGGYKDRVHFGNLSVSLVTVSNQRLASNLAMGVSFAPIGFRVGRNYVGSAGLWIRPTYTRLVGFTGHLSNRNVFGVQCSFAH